MGTQALFYPRACTHTHTRGHACMRCKCADTHNMFERWWGGNRRGGGGGQRSELCVVLRRVRITRNRRGSRGKGFTDAQDITRRELE